LLCDAQVLDASVEAQQGLGAGDKETDDVIRLFSETAPWLLALTLVVSVVHMALDTLALSADVSFWSSTSSLRGVSVRSVAVQLVTNSIITFYLWHEGASLLVSVPQAAFSLLGVWKLARAAGCECHRPGGSWLPKVAINSRLAATAVEGVGGEADRQAVGTMLWLLLPLAAGFSLHALVYHREYCTSRASCLLYAQHDPQPSNICACRVHWVDGLGPDHRGRLCAHIRLCCHDAAVVRELAAEERGPHALEVSGGRRRGWGTMYPAATPFQHRYAV